MAESKTMRAAAAYALVAAAVLSTSTSSTGVAAVPMPNQRSPESSSGSAGAVRSFPISRRQPSKHRSGDELRAWANRHRSGLRNKYGLNKGNKESANSRRDSAGSATLVNYEHDSTWYASVEMGTPSQSFDLVLDTGSSDLWVSADHYNSASSSSFKNSSTPFQITYGSGQVAGNLATDTVTLAGHTVNSQTFAIADQVSQGLLDGNVAGIMGMGFQSLASSRAPPFWQNADLSDDTFACELRSLALAIGAHRPTPFRFAPPPPLSSLP